MPNPTDNLQNTDRTSQTLAVPYGRHVFKGHLIMSENVGGADPSHQIKSRWALCEGDIEGIEGVWYAGTGIDSSSYTLHDGSQTTAPASPFDQDFAHFKTAMLDLTLPVGMADEDVKNSPPTELAIIGKCLKTMDYDADGGVVGESYSPNAARTVADLIVTRGGESIGRIDWLVWTNWKNAMDATETVDYSAIAGFDGIGLTGSYYSDTAFTTLVLTRIDPNIFFETSDGAPALGLGDAFSVRWEGKLKAKTSGSYTFTADHDNSIKLWVGDLTTPLIDNTVVGTDTATKTLAADTFYDIKVEWVDLGGPAQCRLLWTPPSEASQVIPQQFLYPKAEAKPKYEAHALFEQAIDLDTAVRQVLLMTNSIMQMDEGQRKFYLIEDLTPVMEIDTSLIKDGTFKWYRRDRRELRNHWEVVFRDLESQYLEIASPPITKEFPDLQDARGIITGQAIDLDNMTHWQAIKVLDMIVRREVSMDIFCEFDGTADTYMLLPGDLVTLTHPGPGWSSKQFMVIEATDYSAESTPDRRGFVLMEWE